MYAIFEERGKQYCVKKNQIIRIEHIKNSKKNQQIEFKNIIMISNKKNTILGTPYLIKKKIIAKIKKNIKTNKIKIIKFKRRKHYIKQKGHKQYMTEIKIINIL